MDLIVKRFEEYEGSTISRLYIDDIEMGYGLEDGFNSPKIPGETRIPSGRYRLKLRTHGGFHSRYQEAGWIPEEIHKGMIEICNVPDFMHVLFHTGNTKKDTGGCLLCGSTFIKGDDGFFISSSRTTYLQIYPMLAAKLSEGEDVWIEIEDVAYDDVGLSDNEVDYMYRKDEKRCIAEAQTVIDDFGHLSDGRKIAILNMIFQLGLPTFLEFEKTIAAINAGNFHEAANEILDSKYARKDTSGRAKRNAERMRTGKMES